MLPPNATCARQTMAFSLIDDDDRCGTDLRWSARTGLPPGARTRRPRERDWVARDRVYRRSRQAGAGARRGRQARPRAGRRGRGEAAMWAFAGLSETLPRTAAIGSSAAGRRPIRAALALGWALGTYAFTRYRKKKKAAAPTLVWPEGADRGLVERLAGGGVPGARPDQHAGLGSRARRAGRRRGRRSPRAPARATGSSPATRCSPRTTRRSTRSAAPARARRGWSTSSGATRRRRR